MTSLSLYIYRFVNDFTITNVFVSVSGLTAHKNFSVI